MEILCFFAGLVFYYLDKVTALVLLLLLNLSRRHWLGLIAFPLAIGYAALHEQRLALDLDFSRPKCLEGYVASIPVKKSSGLQFYFDNQSIDGKPQSASFYLSCYRRCPKLKAGQKLRLRLLLRRPRSLANPGSYDFEAYAAAHHIQALGSFQKNQIEGIEPAGKAYWLLQWRERAAEWIASLSPDKDSNALIQALTLGLTSSIDTAEWDLFRRTGTVHLMVISGAHIGLVAGFVFSLCKKGFGVFPALCLRIPAAVMASIFSFFAALAYAFIAGFAVPAQRSLLMCTVFLLRYFLPLRFSPWQAWRLALFLILLLEPHALLLPGFYLSFLAVAVLMLCSGRLPTATKLQFLWLQLACLCGLLPLSLYWFSYASFSSVAANLAAVPWVGFLLVPLGLICLLTAWIPGLAFLQSLLLKASHLLLWYLQQVDAISGFNLHYSLPNPLLAIAAMLGLACLVFLPLRLLLLPALLLLCLPFFPKPQRPAAGELYFDLLDVGQGLATVLRTKQHLLVYDTGLKAFHGSDMGTKVLIPYLERLGIRYLDKIVISHPDLDHRGGLPALQARFPYGALLVDNPSFYKQALNCHDYPAWTWDGVDFQFLPLGDSLSSRNNRSCVLKVSTKGQSLLLTGDIEKEAEQLLLQEQAAALASTVLIVPHHASKTSSSLAFLKAVAPELALVSYGFNNRYHFPHPTTLEHYKQLGIPLYNTVDCGMISLKMTATEHSIQCFRLNAMETKLAYVPGPVRFIYQ